MAKILKIENQIVTIGLDNGGIEEVRSCDISFDPEVGDLVDIFKNSDTTIVTKREKEVQQESEGVHVNVTNNIGGMNETRYGKKKVVNKVVYCLLAFFLGGLGVHKFYSGRIGLGIAYILFAWTWIPCIIGVIEGIIGITKKADVNGNILI